MVLYWRAEQLLWMKHVTSAGERHGGLQYNGCRVGCANAQHAGELQEFQQARLWNRQGVCPRAGSSLLQGIQEDI